MNEKIYFLTCIFKYFKPLEHKSVVIVMKDNKSSYAIYDDNSVPVDLLLLPPGNSYSLKKYRNGIVIRS